MADAQKDALLPCPFCGAQPEMKENVRRESYSAADAMHSGMGFSGGSIRNVTYAIECACGIEVESNNDDFLRARWNTRVALARADAVAPEGAVEANDWSDPSVWALIDIAKECGAEEFEGEFHFTLDAMYALEKRMRSAVSAMQYAATRPSAAPAAETGSTGAIGDRLDNLAAAIYDARQQYESSGLAERWAHDDDVPDPDYYTALWIAERWEQIASPTQDAAHGGRG